MISSESILERLPSQKVIEAVDKSSDGTVIASDVAATAGVSLSQARRDLTALASISRGDIAVSDDGDLIYTFPSNLNGVLASNSQKFKLLQLARKAWPPIFYGVRVSFGVVLLLSLFAIFSSIVVLTSAGGGSDSDSDNDRRRNDREFGGGMSFGGFWGPSPFDFFYYRPYYGYYYTPPGQPRRDPDEMGFLESVFSYIFGDGNPNEMIEEQRLRLASNLIRENNGAVTAEQLALFCDDAPQPDMGQEETYVDESFVLPIVTALNGEPRVTEEGDIVYVFPELQMSAAKPTSLPSRQSNNARILKRAGLSPDASTGEIKMLLRLNGIDTRGALERADLMRALEKALGMDEEDYEDLDDDDGSMLLEKEYKFSLAPGGNLVLAGILGAVNLGGALYLGRLLTAYSLYGVRLPSYLGLVQQFYPALLAYAVLFNVIPALRSFWVNSRNSKIQERNKKRRLWRTVLSSGVSRIQRKLKAATRLGSKMKKLRASDSGIVFDTSKALDEQETKRQKDMLDEFDKMLGN